MGKRKSLAFWELEEQEKNAKRKEREEARFRNLPKWAQERIQRLERQVESMKVERNKLVSQEETQTWSGMKEMGNHIYLPDNEAIYFDYSGPEKTKGRNSMRYLAARKLTQVNGELPQEFRGIEVRSSTLSLLVLPKSSNVVEILIPEY